MIHGIDTYKLLTEVNKQAAKAGRIVNCLLQIHVAQEATKFGFSPEECKDMLHAGEWKELSHVRICGSVSYTHLDVYKRQEQRAGSSSDQLHSFARRTGDYKKERLYSSKIKKMSYFCSLEIELTV